MTASIAMNRTRSRGAAGKKNHMWGYPPYPLPIGLGLWCTARLDVITLAVLVELCSL
jgi:hypothetical protein